MRMETRIVPAFSVMGREGSTKDGRGFISRLWAEANEHFAEIAPLAKTDENHQLCGLWGLMSDFSRSFQPWQEQYTQGLYLAGVECQPDAVPPEGWTRWDVPGFEYICAECGEPGLFDKMLDDLTKRQMTLAGAVHDYTCPATGRNYMYFPIRKL